MRPYAIRRLGGSHARARTPDQEADRSVLYPRLAAGLRPYRHARGRGYLAGGWLASVLALLRRRRHGVDHPDWPDAALDAPRAWPRTQSMSEVASSDKHASSAGTIRALARVVLARPTAEIEASAVSQAQLLLLDTIG